MANPTTNFGWVMPTSASLVTNLPADFNTFGQAVDTSMSELLGGTTGQVLSKTSNTNMDFTWVTPTDQTPLTTKGDLFTFSTVDARLAVGTNKYVLGADSTQSTGLAWQTSPQSIMTTTGDTLYASAANTPARLGIGSTSQVLTVAGGVPTWATPAINWVAVNSGGTALSGSTTTISGITGANQLMVLMYGGSSTNTYVEFYARINNDTGGNYLYAGVNQSGSTTGNFSSNAATKIIMAGGSSSATAAGYGSVVITGGNASGVKSFSSTGSADAGGGSGVASFISGGYWNNSATITEINFFPSAGTWDAGTVYVFKSA